MHKLIWVYPVIRSVSIWSTSNDYGVSLEADEHIYIHVHYMYIVLGFNDTSTLVDHFVSSSREREKRDSIDSREDERER